MSEIPAAGREVVDPKSGIVIPDPDQGTRYVQLDLAVPPGLIIGVWEPFEDGSEGGHNLYGFLERWDAWVAGEAAHLQAIEPRFGHPIVIPRHAIPLVFQIGIGIRRREDTRAPVRSLAVPNQPRARRLADGSIEIQVPR